MTMKIDSMNEIDDHIISLYLYRTELLITCGISLTTTMLTQPEFK
jgi:hypothetical protein